MPKFTVHWMIADPVFAAAEAETPEEALTLARDGAFGDGAPDKSCWKDGFALFNDAYVKDASGKVVFGTGLYEGGAGR